MSILTHPPFNLRSHSYNISASYYIGYSLIALSVFFASVAFKCRYLEACGVVCEVVRRNIDSSLETFITRQFYKPESKEKHLWIVFGFDRC